MGWELEPRAMLDPKVITEGNGGESRLAVAGNNKPPKNPNVTHAWNKLCGDGGNDPNWITDLATSEDADDGEEAASCLETS